MFILALKAAGIVLGVLFVLAALAVLVLLAWEKLMDSLTGKG